MLSTFWSGFLRFVEKNSKENPVIYSLLKQLRPIEMSEKHIVLSCDNPGFVFFLQKKIHFVEGYLFDHTKKRLRIEIVVKAQNKRQEPPLLRFEPTIEDVFKKAGLNGTFTFDNFAVSSSNQVAYAAAQAVSDSIGKAYNPLVLYGGVGVGKTHLAQAIAQKVLAKKPNKKVLFSPGDLFTNELIEGIREKNTPKFRRKYRQLNLLIVDDVQFIAGKNTVQEEFFHTFNAVISNGGQIVLTSDKPPHEIRRLEDRLRSRFAGGLTVDIQSPDFELRSAILLIKAREKNIDIDLETAKIIAEQVADSRALEGTLLSLYAKTLSNGGKINLEAVEDFFMNVVEQKNKRVSPHDIIKTICTYYDVRQSQLKSPNRAENIALPRQIAMYLLRKELGLKYDQIATLLKRKDHTTVLHGFEKIKSLLARNDIFKKEVDRIVNTL
ncbi:chromosomal replication initiator protein DnaA [Candidatus Roizmanbacteria bacterium RIFCSPLOWO2_12_FULL_40_12]|nr:MAG: chromosomal replication initiator protein DnaA [Candidatus Roizmanbacteria bacterium RIFCSPHIGHO2_01_FULL_40_98]OGK28762.1 MAG: chromosomal replication initiator protein DnaA [Candidatus Roizmanbacteria bacterium RIFCSPHIGHO2_02_FULL_40_53]OGK36345.1 MAG: chromosomal replication initiator protein DnaA [Candidatus Roizmanbacteria bacterium RIFCSPHIGHO2_12_FULL_40_130]OGK60347.1 MAG: chromosomal replication initiator protein DnaA [Candidatus Roizmanbacteria bacterium RIFCSPLOWO2_12_FULL_40